MENWNYIVIGATFFLLFFLIFNEIKRAKKARLFWRITASIFAAFSLACVALPVEVTVTKNVDNSKEAILITEGFNADSLRTFLNNNDSKQFLVYSTNPEIIRSAKTFNPVLISEIEFLNHSSEKLNAVHIFGYGFKKHELPQSDSTTFIFHPSQIPTGITAINWQKKLTSGDKLFVQGNFNNNLSHEIKLVLRGLHTNLDSVIIPSDTNRTFELATIPKHLDRAIYAIIATNKTDTIEREDIPVEVTTPENIKILILAASPDFENKFLKNWLSRNGYEVAIRDRISTNKFQKEYVNSSSISLDNISGAVLQKFDVLIADAAELALISKSEVAIIQSQVENKGLGLIVKADSSVSKASFYSRDFTIVKGKENTAKPVALYLKGATEKIPALAISDPVFIRADAGTQSIIHDDKSFVFANSKIYGNGKIILTTLQNTYTLSLAGNHENYNALWTLLLDKAARKYPAKETITFSPALPVLNEPATLSIQNNNQALPENIGDEKIYLQQNKLLPFIHTGTYWPSKSGWIPAANVEGKINWLYVYNKNNWKALQALNKIQVTKKYVAENRPANIKNNKISKFVPVLIPKIYFFIIFMLLAGFLWFEKKLP